MKIKELIKQLSEENPNDKVYYIAVNDNYEEITTVGLCKKGVLLV